MNNFEKATIEYILEMLPREDCTSSKDFHNAMAAIHKATKEWRESLSPSPQPSATVCSKTEPTKPTINDYPITDERTFLNLNGSVNWQRYAKALDAYIETIK